MASLTPGILQKLLLNSGDKDFKVAGEHRSPLLQVIGIVPSIEDDPWKSRGYYLRVSDSLHSAYVAVSDEDVELVLSDKVQLGQFIHVTRLDSGSPVPVLRGIKPIPKRRPCLGEPKDLISSDFLNSKKVEKYSKSKSKGKIKKVVGDEQLLCSNMRRLSFGGIDSSRRLSLDSARKGWISSPLSKNGVEGALKCRSKESSNSVVKKVVADNSPKRLSFSPITKSKKAIFPDNSPKSSTFSPIVKSKKTISDDSPKSSTFSSPLKNKNVIVSPKPMTKPAKSIKLTKPVENLKLRDDDSKFPIDLDKVVLSSKECSEVKIVWDALPSTICNLGKEVQSCRNVAYGSAVRALEEASVYEGVVRCMSMFGELCELSKKDTHGPLVEQFLNIHESMKKASADINTLIHSKKSDAKDSKRDASLWVQAAVETNLSKFSLYTHEEEKDEKGIKKGENFHYLVIENPPQKIETEHYSTKKVTAPKAKSSRSRQLLSTTKPKSGLRDADNLLEKLISFSRAWFLDYLEDSLNNGFGFGLRSDESSQIAVLLGQLKRVNQWMEDAFRGDCVGDKIEKLRKKLYRFLLDHVDSAVSHR
ncbi:hypothetical protein ABFX02_14G163800 [Erythranthe guttata]